jgi:hypothetical protein
MPLTLPFQELPPISVARVVPTVSLAVLGLVGGSDPTEAVLPSPGSTHSGRSMGRTPERPSLPPVPAVQHTLTLDKLIRAGRRGAVGAGGVHQPGAADAWPLHGGEAGQRWAAGAAGGDNAAAAGRHPSALYFTGHRDGRVRAWDATTRVPSLLLTMPFGGHAGQERLRTVTALEVCVLGH